MTQGKNSIGFPRASDAANDTAANNPVVSKSDCGETSDESDMLNAPGPIDDTPPIVLDERIQAQIGQQLSSFYRELVNQPIPPNFMELLARLDRQEDGK